MNTTTQQLLKRFERRVRFVRSWRSAVLGACIGAGLGVVWAGLDWAGVIYAEWPGLLAVLLTGFLLGGTYGFASPVSEKSLATSIDRRAELENRLGSAREITDGEFGDALREDAESHLALLQPAQVFPIKRGRSEIVTLTLSALAALIFLLGNSPALLGEKAKKDRNDMKAEAKRVERVTRENLETPEAKRDMSDKERQMANELSRLSRDLDKAHVNKEDAQAKENELAKKADELMHQQADQAQQSINSAQSALEQMERSEMDRQGMNNVSLAQAQMSDSQRQSARSANKAKQDELKKQLSAIDKKLEELRKKLAKSGLSEAERKELEKEMKELEAQKKALEQQMKQAEDEAKAMELSEEARKVFQKMTEDPLFKKLQELQKKMQQSMPGGSRPPLTREEREELKRQLEELAKQLGSDKAMKEYLQAMMEAMQQMEGMGRMQGIGMGLGPLIPIWGNGAPGDDKSVMPYDLGRINKTDKPVAGRGSTTISSVTGEQRPGGGPEQYVEIKAPSTVGNRSSVPFVNVLPSYRRKAEQALDHQQIPKEQEKRVREYFESLNGK